LKRSRRTLDIYINKILDEVHRYYDHMKKLSNL